jgi:hypothetical protein
LGEGSGHRARTSGRKIVVNPDRPDRLEPRAVKRRPKEYDRLTRPRAELRRRLLEAKAVA